jgi:hypothetical protein
VPAGGGEVAPPELQQPTDPVQRDGGPGVAGQRSRQDAAGLLPVAELKERVGHVGGQDAPER